LLTGYSHPLYAASLAEFGKPRELSRSGGWILEREVPGFSDHDAMGCYPIFSANNWASLKEDLADIGHCLVSVALVADPFGDYASADLRQAFDTVVAFKEHYAIDFSKSLRISDHHSYYSRRARAEVAIEVGPPPGGFAVEWSGLYDSLVRRHKLKGIKAFSDMSFDMQMRVPGMVVFRAIKNGSLVGAHLWFVKQNVAYSHLAASSEQGYKLNCSYAIHSAVVEYFRSKVQYVDLGAGAGTATQSDGLSRFKSGWSNSTRPAYFCGRVLNPERYETLARIACRQETSYFPAYRNGEFG
jgi:hypothetical protein